MFLLNPVHIILGFFFFFAITGTIFLSYNEGKNV